MFRYLNRQGLVDPRLVFLKRTVASSVFNLSYTMGKKNHLQYYSIGVNKSRIVPQKIYDIEKAISSSRTSREELMIISDTNCSFDEPMCYILRFALYNDRC